MPLPEGGNVPWPPEHCQKINEQYAVWGAWYSGDVERLANIYGGGGPTGDTTGFFASETGGFKAGVRRVARAVRRWFWGSNTAGTQSRTRLHVPIAGDIASASADMLFSEPPSITIPVPDRPAPAAGETPPEPVEDPTQKRLDELIDDGAHATLLEAAEQCAALGGVYLRVVWDPAVRPGRPWLNAVAPDVAVPEWSWGRLTAVTFWRELKRDGKLVVRHLERHEPGQILHGVYQGTVDELGQVVSLAEYPETKGLVNEQLVDGNTVKTGAEGLAAVYVPNMRPNRIWHHNRYAVHLGRSDYSGVEPLMDALDLVQSSWIRDVDLGKARLVVPREYMQSNGPGKGASVDLDQELYEPINAMSPEDGKPAIEQVQFDIRVDDHSRTVADLKTTIVGSAGYSASTFGLDDTSGGAITATETNSQDRRSLITRDRKTRYWRPELADLTETMLEIDAALFHTAITPQRPLVEFAPGVSVDPLAQAQTLRELHTAEAISPEEKVRTLRPDWDDAAVAEEVDRIKEYYARGAEDPTKTLAGFAGNGDPAADPGNEGDPYEE
jgi:hypothetical protein